MKKQIPYISKWQLQWKNSSLVFTQVVWVVCILSVHAICTIFLSIACNLFHTHQMFSSCRLPWTLNRRKASVKHMFTSNCVNLASIKWTAFVFFIWFYPQMGTDTRNGDWVNYGFGWTVQRCEADFGDPTPKASDYCMSGNRVC